MVGKGLRGGVGGEEEGEGRGGERAGTGNESPSHLFLYYETFKWNSESQPSYIIEKDKEMMLLPRVIALVHAQLSRIVRQRAGNCWLTDEAKRKLNGEAPSDDWRLDPERGPRIFSDVRE